MAVEIRIPKLGMAIDEGTLSSWEVEDGEDVLVGSPLYCVETDKTEVEVESPVAGTIRLIGEEGQTYPIGTLIAVIDTANGTDP